MTLLDFFLPLNWQSLLLFLSTLLVFDAIGSLVATRLKFPEELRPAYWIFGLGVFVLLWFVAHFFLPFSPALVKASVLMLGVFFLPWYFGKKKLNTLATAVFHMPLPLFFLSLAAKPLWILTNLPPYLWDELAYHLYSPAKLLTEQRWPFLEPTTCQCWGLYDMLPKFLETAYVLFFSLTATYATARLLQLAIFISAVMVIATILKKEFGLFVASGYSFLALFLRSDLLLAATYGYVDVGTAALSGLAVLLGVYWTWKPQNGTLIASAAVTGIALGSKYSSLGFLASFWLILGIYVVGVNVLHRPNLKDLLKRNFKELLSLILALGLAATIFGGYWYLKNMVITGNPIFPFLFPCFKEFSCQTAKTFFEGWSIPFSFKNFVAIRDDLFQHNVPLFWLTVNAIAATVLFGLLFRRYRSVGLTIFIVITVMLEVLITQYMTGYVSRYFYHWLMIMPLVLVMPLSIPIQWSAPKFWYTISLLCAIVFYYKTAGLIWHFGRFHINRMYSSEVIPEMYQDYATRRVSLTSWIEKNFPNTDEVISACGKYDTMTELLIADPKVIWSSPEGLFRGFLVGCHFRVLPVVNESEMDSYITNLKEKYPNAITVSLDACNPEKPAITLSEYDESYRNHYVLNQKLICRQTKIGESMYHFNDIVKK